MNPKLTNIIHECDFCVVGGGLAGMCAAIAAARHGLKVVIMHDRPVFGGNASSEVRMWVSGAHGENMRETGILEEMCLENLYRNPYRTFPIWDSVLFEAIKNEENITSLLNCSCNDCTMDGNTITEIVGWQTTTQKFHTVKAAFFADCSGDSILAPLSGAEFTWGREARSKFNESIAPVEADRMMMGHSCLVEGRETDEKRIFVAPDWARKFTKEQLAHRFHGQIREFDNFWYLELGGTQDTIGDTEEIRDDLVKVAFGFWDHVKNSGYPNLDNWDLDWIGYLPGKRESRRYVGDYTMTQNDITDGGKFDDMVAYGGWTMDDHNPLGINTTEKPTIHHPAPSPFGIPYRVLYSKNIDNLFFAGRNISVTHSAMSATRVMATCALVGQAVGTAAALTVKQGTSPRGIYENHIHELKQTLMEDGCYLPGNTMEPSEIMKRAQIVTDGQNGHLLVNGHERQIGQEKNCWTGKVGTPIEIQFAESTQIRQVRIVLDSDLDRKTIGTDFMARKATLTNRPLGLAPVHLPETLVKELKIEALDEQGCWQTVFTLDGNRQRIVTAAVDCCCSALRITPVASYGCEEVNIFSINVK